MVLQVPSPRARRGLRISALTLLTLCWLSCSDDADLGQRAHGGPSARVVKLGMIDNRLGHMHPISGEHFKVTSEPVETPRIFASTIPTNASAEEIAAIDASTNSANVVLTPFFTDDGDFWLVIYDLRPERVVKEQNDTVFRFVASPKGWRLKSVGACERSDSPSADPWLSIDGGSIRIESKSCNPAQDLACEFELKVSRGESAFTRKGAFRYNMAMSMEGIPDYLLRQR